MNNGDGLRVVLWLSGCNHGCYNCQNPQTWDVNSGIPFDDAAKEELFRELDKDYISGLTLSGGDPLHEANLNDVLDLVTEINKRYNFQKTDYENQRKMVVSKTENTDKIRLSCPNKSIWLYSGFRWEEVFDIEHMKKEDNDFLIWNKRAEIVSKCTIMIDGKYIDSQRDISLRWRGSSNQRIVNISESLKQGRVITIE